MIREQLMPYAGIEPGGTKVVCLVASGPDDIRAQVIIPTTLPDETLAKVIGFFRGHEPFAGMGIATFGPCDLNRASTTYGFITTTPKAGWQNVNLLGILGQAFRFLTCFLFLGRNRHLSKLSICHLSNSLLIAKPIFSRM